MHRCASAVRRGFPRVPRVPGPSASAEEQCRPIHCTCEKIAEAVCNCKDRGYRREAVGRLVDCTRQSRRHLQAAKQSSEREGFPAGVEPRRGQVHHARRFLEQQSEQRARSKPQQEQPMETQHEQRLSCREDASGIFRIAEFGFWNDFCRESGSLRWIGE